MNEDETITSYLLKVDEVVNVIRGLGEEVKESIVIQKVLRSLTPKFDSKVFVVEEIQDLDKLEMDGFHGILTAYEMRKNEGRLPKMEVTLKAEKKSKSKKVKDEKCSDVDGDQLIAFFSKKLRFHYCHVHFHYYHHHSHMCLCHLHQMSYYPLKYINFSCS